MNNTEKISPEAQKKTCRVGRTGRGEKARSIKVCKNHTKLREGVLSPKLGASKGFEYFSMLLKELDCIDEGSHDPSTTRKTLAKPS